jgi:hypothetical protein
LDVDSHAYLLDFAHPFWHNLQRQESFHHRVRALGGTA